VRALHILLVDDEVRFVQSLAKLLKARGFTVSTAYTGLQALERLRDHVDIEVVVLDIQMPGMDGIETLRQIKQTAPATEVILLTGQATLESGIQAIRQGAFDYLLKPCGVEDLVEKIRAAGDVGCIRRHPVLWPRSTAGEIILYGFIPLLPEDGLDKALAVFNRYRGGQAAETLFIVDDRQRIQGLVPKQALLAAALRSQPDSGLTWESLSKNPHYQPHTTLGEIMGTRVLTVSSDTPLAEVAREMLAHNLQSMPVVADGIVSGVIRLRDVFQYLDAGSRQRASPE